MYRKILILCLTLLLLVSCLVPVSAKGFDPEEKGSVTVTLREQHAKLPIAGAELRLYYIATVESAAGGALTYSYTRDFANFGISLDDPDLAVKLDACLSQYEMPGQICYTDANGTAVWKNLPLGLYLVRQTNLVVGFAPCIPFLVTVPMSNGTGYLYAVNASPKTEVAKETTVTVRKVWNTDASAKAADSVTVQLKRNGKLLKTAVLSEDNNWQITYTNMPQSDAYSVEEVDIPAGFTATYRQNGNVFTVINTAALIQTGQLIWPIPVLAFVGVLLLTAGCMLLQKKRDGDG